MTENKRYSFNWKNGHPNFWDNHCDLADCYLTCGDVVNILNELNDENEQLKIFLKAVNEELSLANRDYDTLEEENEQLRKENDMLSCELSVSANKEISRNCRIAELEEENKQLKSTIAQLIEQNRINNDLLLSDIKILEKALWCSGCENDYGRLKELRKEFMRG